MEVIAETHQHFLTSLALNVLSGELYALCAASGEVLRCDVERRTFIQVAKANSSPVSFAFLTDRNDARCVLVCPAQRSLLAASVTACTAATAANGSSEDPPEVELTPFLVSSAAFPFIAPAAVCTSPVDGEVFFTGAGSEGDASLSHAIGAVYHTAHHHSTVVALQQTGLAQPSGIAVGRDGCVYVTEMCENRLLRYVPRGGGLQHTGTVFTQFHGSMGPSAVAVHPRTGHIFVALYEAAEVGQPYVAEVGDATSDAPPPPPLQGRVVELDLDGEEVCTHYLPDTQLRALAFDLQGDYVYVVSSDTATCWSTLYRIAIY